MNSSSASSAALVNLLSAALLADDEFIAGPMEWATYVDPFPAWHDAEAEH